MQLHELFEGIEYDDPLNIYPDFKVRVVASHLPPTHELFEYHHASTEALVTRLFAGQRLGRLAVHPTFVFPERYLSPQQVRDFMQRLAESPEAKAGQIAVVDIVTGSPVILTDFTANMIRKLVDYAPLGATES